MKLALVLVIAAAGVCAAAPLQEEKAAAVVEVSAQKEDKLEPMRKKRSHGYGAAPGGAYGPAASAYGSSQGFSVGLGSGVSGGYGGGYSSGPSAAFIAPAGCASIPVASFAASPYHSAIPHASYSLGGGYGGAPHYRADSHEDTDMHFSEDGTHMAARSYGYDVLPAASSIAGGGLSGGVSVAASQASGPAFASFPGGQVGGCQTPLLLSCSPSVVRGQLVAAQPHYGGGAYGAQAAGAFASAAPSAYPQRLLGAPAALPVGLGAYRADDAQPPEHLQQRVDERPAPHHDSIPLDTHEEQEHTHKHHHSHSL